MTDRSSTETCDRLQGGLWVMPLDALVTEPELARSTGTSTSLWATRRREQSGPPHIRIGRRLLYRVRSVRDWLEAQERQ